MANLRILGGLWLENEQTSSAGRGGQRRRLALLALLWLSPQRRLTRDKVLAILWPEAPAIEGRRRLSTAVYDLRKSLGDDIVISNGDELWIPPECSLTCDVDCFDAAIAERDWEKAVASYHGLLFDGVHLPEAPEFEEWISLHRERLRRAYVHAIEQVLTLRRETGNHGTAITAARLLLDLEPLNERIALIAASAIATSGAPAEAVRSLDQYTTRVRTELGVLPHARVLELASSFRTTPFEPVRAVESVALIGLGEAEQQQHLIAEKIDHDAITVARPSAPLPLRANVTAANGPGHKRILAAQSIGAVAVVSLLVAAYTSRAQTAIREQGVVIVEPLESIGDSLETSIRVRIDKQLTNALNQTGAFDADASTVQADRRRTKYVVTGSVRSQPNDVRISVMLRDRRSGASVSSTEYNTTTDSIDVATNFLARALIAGALESAAHHLSAVAARSTTSIPALKAFLIGDRQYRLGQFTAAATSFEAAVASDSAFALAHYRLSESLLWENKPATLATLHDSLARAYAMKLPLEERVLLDAYFAWRRGDATRAESLYRALVARNPRNAEAWYQLAETLFHYNPLRGRSNREAYEIFDWAIALDSTNWGAHWHIALLDADKLKQTELRSRTNVLLDGHSEGYIAAELELFAANADDGELARRAEGASATVLYDAAWRRAIYRHDLAGAEALLLTMTHGNRPMLEQHKGAYMAAGLRLARGRVRDALSLLAVDQPTLNDNEAIIMLVQATLTNHLHTGAANADSLRVAVERWQQANRGVALHADPLTVMATYLHGLLAVEGGDASVAARDIKSLDRMTDVWRTPRSLAHGVRAFQAFHDGNCASTFAQLDSAVASIWLGYVASAAIASQGFERLLRANCLQKTGRHREAIAWYASLEQNTLYDLMFLGNALRGQAVSFRALGDTLAAGHIEARLAALSSAPH